MGMPEEHKIHITRPPAGTAAGEGAAKPEGESTAAPAGGEAKNEGAAPAAAGAAPAEAKPEVKQPRSILADPATLAEMPAVAMGCCVALMRPDAAAALGFGNEDEADAGRFRRASLLTLRGAREAAVCSTQRPVLP